MPDKSQKPCCGETMDRMMSDSRSVESCPMAKMCRGAMGRVKPGLFLAVAGTALLLFGALIFLKPALLAWFVAGMLIFIGVGMVAGAVLASRFSTRPRAA